MISGKDGTFTEWWKNAERLSADQLLERANLTRLYFQRHTLRSDNVQLLYRNHQRSVFFQLDLDHTAQFVAQHQIQLPDVTFEQAGNLTAMHERMFARG